LIALTIELPYPTKVIVQWGSNQNAVFEFAVREILVLPTLKASQELNNWYFTMNSFP